MNLIIDLSWRRYWDNETGSFKRMPSLGVVAHRGEPMRLPVNSCQHHVGFNPIIPIGGSDDPEQEFPRLLREAARMIEEGDLLGQVQRAMDDNWGSDDLVHLELPMVAEVAVRRADIDKALARVRDDDVMAEASATMRSEHIREHLVDLAIDALGYHDGMTLQLNESFSFPEFDEAMLDQIAEAGFDVDDLA